MKSKFAIPLAMTLFAASAAMAAPPRNKYTKEMIGDTIRALRETSLCEGLDEQIKKMTADAEVQMDLAPGTVAPDMKVDANGQSIIEACHEKLDYLAYLERATSGNLIRYGASIQLGFEINTSYNVLDSKLLGPSIGVSASKGILVMTGDRFQTKAISTLGATPISIGKGRSLPIEPHLFVVGYYSASGVPSYADIAGDYVRLGLDFPNPFSSALHVRTNTEGEIMRNTHSPVYAFILPILLSHKWSGMESRGVDLHLGVNRVYISNPSTEGQLKGTDNSVIPSPIQDIKELYHSTDLDELVAETKVKIKHMFGY